MPVEFDQENSFNQNFNKNFAKSNVSKINLFLIKHKFAKDDKQANIILLGVSFVSIVLTAVILNVSVFGGGFLKKKTTNQNAKILKEYQAQGLKGKALFDRIQADKKAGILK